MSRTLDDDFDDVPAGGLDLEKGSGASPGAGGIGGGAASAYGGGGGLQFDDDLEDEPMGGPLELDVPAPPSNRAAPSVPELPIPPPAPSSSRGVAAPPARPSGTMAAAPAPDPSSSRMPAAHGAPPPPAPHSSEPGGVALPNAPGSSRDVAAQPPPSVPQPPSAAQLVAKYPPAPKEIWQAPVYFVRCVLRQFELRQDLTALRRRRSPDVPLYEAALKAYDPKTYTLGLVITLAGATIATFLFFLPVFKRFLWND